MATTLDHYPYSSFKKDEHTPSVYDIIVLNCSKSSLDKHMTKEIWSGARNRICADGGSNELRRFTLEKKQERIGHYTPTIITGDLDSMTEDTQKFYKESAVEFIEIPEQDSTDFSKCVQVLQKKWRDEPKGKILVFGTFAGRFDQAIGNIHTLYLYSALDIIIISEEDITFLLKPGMNRIYVRSPLRGQYCSLIPFAGPVRAITTGLRWDLDSIPGLELNFNTMISTSNAYNESALSADGFVTINTPTALVWSMTFAE